MLIGSGLLLAPGAHATSVTYGMDTEFSGGTAPSGPVPWVTVTIDDSFGGANTVRVTLTGENLTGGQAGEGIGGVYLNFDPVLDPTMLSFTAVDVTDSMPNAVTGATNAYKADGDGFFDILFDFPPPPGDDAARFTDGESIVYDLTYIAPIDANSFAFESAMGGGNGSWIVAAHVQRTNGGVDPDSGWVGYVPEPGTALLLGSGLLMLAGRSGRRV